MRDANNVTRGAGPGRYVLLQQRHAETRQTVTGGPNPQRTTTQVEPGSKVLGVFSTQGNAESAAKDASSRVSSRNTPYASAMDFQVVSDPQHRIAGNYVETTLPKGTQVVATFSSK